MHRPHVRSFQRIVGACDSRSIVVGLIRAVTTTVRNCSVGSLLMLLLLIRMQIFHERAVLFSQNLFVNGKFVWQIKHAKEIDCFFFFVVVVRVVVVIVVVVVGAGLVQAGAGDGRREHSYGSVACWQRKAGAGFFGRRQPRPSQQQRRPYSQDSVRWAHPSRHILSSKALLIHGTDHDH